MENLKPISKYKAAELYDEGREIKVVIGDHRPIHLKKTKSISFFAMLDIHLSFYGQKNSSKATFYVNEIKVFVSFRGNSWVASLGPGDKRINDNKFAGVSSFVRFLNGKHLTVINKGHLPDPYKSQLIY